MSKIPVGTKVRITRPFMDVSCGEELEIVEVDNTAIPYRVRLADGTHRWLVEDLVEPVKDSPLRSQKRWRKVGDKVRIKSRYWYEANRDGRGNVDVPYTFVPDMAKYCGQIMAIKATSGDGCYYLQGAGDYAFSEEMFDTNFDSDSTHRVLYGAFTPSATPNQITLINSKTLLTNIKLN